MKRQQQSNRKSSKMPMIIVVCAVLVISPISNTARADDAWTKLDTASFGWLENIAYGGGLFVAVGDNGMIVTSPDGKNWTRKTTAVTEDFSGVAYGNGTWIAVTWEGSIYSSTNTDTWSLKKSAESGEWLSGAAFGNGVFVASGGAVFASGDGSTWQEKSTSTHNLSGIAYVNNKFVVVGDEILTSIDGSSWLVSLPTASVSKHLSGIAYGNGNFLATEETGTVYLSKDATTWTKGSSGASEWLDKAVFGNGMFVAVGQKGALLKSIDGVTWTPISYGTAGSLNGVAFGNNTFAAVGIDVILSAQAAPTSADAGIVVSPVSHDYGSLTTGNTGDMTVTILNTGSTALNIGSLGLTGPDAAQFSIHSDFCSNTALTTFLTCTVGVQFTQTTEGIKNAVLNIPTNDPESPVKTVILSAINKYNLSVTKSGSCWGSFSSNSPGVSCSGSNCSGKIAYGTEITINSAPGSGCGFSGWSGACAGTGSCNFTMTADSNVTGSFPQKTYTINASAGPNGSISLPGTTTITGCTDKVYYITPAAGYVVSDVKVDDVSLGSQSSGYRFSCNVSQCKYRFSCGKDHTISAFFTANTGTHTITATGAVNPSGSIIVYNGTTAVFTIDPDLTSYGEHIADVKVDLVSVGTVTSYTFSNVMTDHTIDARTAPGKVKLTITATGSGTISISPQGESCGANCLIYDLYSGITISTSSASGVSFEGWSGACSGTGACFLYLYEDAEVTANFVDCDYSLTPSSQKFGVSGGAGTVEVTTNGRECDWTVQNNNPALVTVSPALNPSVWTGDKMTLNVSPDGDKITRTRNVLTGQKTASLILKMPVSGCGASSVTRYINSDIIISNGTFSYSDDNTSISGTFDSQFGSQGTYAYSESKLQCTQLPGYWLGFIYYPGIWLSGTITGSGTWTASSISKSGDVHYAVSSSAVPASGSMTIAGRVFSVSIDMPVSSVSPASLDFGNQKLNATGPVNAVTVSNTGTEPMIISGITTSNEFGQTNNCPASLPAGDSCAVSITFNPVSAGARSGSLDINVESPALSQSVALNGTGDPTLNQYTVTASAGPGGTISPASAVVSYGTATTFTITPTAGYTAAVSGTCNGSMAGNTYTTNAVTGPCTVIAAFTLNQYTVTAASGAGGAISPPSALVSHGSITTFTVTTAAGYHAVVSGCGGTFFGNIYTTGAVVADCTVTATFNNEAPSTPTISSPASATEVTVLTPALSVNPASDADRDPVTYNYEVYADSSLTTNVANGAGQGTSWTVTQALSDNTMYYWRALASDGDLNSLWMPVANFFVNTANDAPTAPGISSPANNAHVASLSPILSVTNGADVDKYDTLTYEFDMAADGGFSNIVASATGIGQGTNTTTWTVSPALSDNTPYYWRVRTMDNHGATSDWASGSFFVNLANDAPSTPTINSPLAGSEVSEVTPALTVNNASDPDLDSLHYIFELDMINTFSSVGKQTSGLMAEGENTTSWTPASLSDNTTWYWRAKANDGLAESPWSTTGSFFVNSANDAPTAPTLNNPANNSQVTTLTPLLSVNAAADLDHDSLTYEFEVYNNSGLTSLVTSTTGAGTSWTVAPALSDNRTYFWRARAKDIHGADSPWMPASAFFVNDNGYDDPPTITVTSPSLETDITSSATFTIRWTATDPDSNADITLGYDASGAGCSGTTIATGLNEDDSENSYAWNLSELTAGTYRVYAIIDDGASRVCSYAEGTMVRRDLRGDINGDGAVDNADALKALRIAAGLEAASQYELKRGDVGPLVNGKPQPDGKIDGADALAILRKVVRLW